MSNEQWLKSMTQTLGKWLKATENLRLQISNAPKDAEIEETLIRLIGQAWTLENSLLLWQALQGTVLPSVLDTRATAELSLSALSVTENRSPSSFDRQKTLIFTSTVSFQITENDAVDFDMFDGAGDWQLVLPLDIE